MSSILSSRLNEILMERREIPATRRIKKVFVAGESAVGKTSMLCKAIFDYFPDFICCARLQDTMRALVRINKSTPIEFTFKESENCLVNISGVSEIRNSLIGAPQYDAVIFIYSIDSKSSFKVINEFRNYLFNLSGEHLPAVLVGNKGDSKREVSKGKGKVKADDWGIPFFEISSRDSNQNEIFSIFDALAKEILAFEKHENPVKSKKGITKCNEKVLEKILITFQMASLLSFIFGIIFLLFGIISSLFSFAFMVRKYLNQIRNGLVIFILLTFGIILIVKSIVSYYAIKKSSIEFMKIVNIY